MSSLSKIFRLALFVLAIFFSVGCSLGPREINAPRTYFLNREISWKNLHRSGDDPPAHSVLLITQPKAQAGFDTAQMAYLLRPYEISYYAYNQWADTPARMLQRIMVENFDKTDQWRAVLQTAGPVSAQYRLDCDNLVLEQQFLSNPSRVRLALRAQFVETKTQSVLATRYFEFFETAPSDDPYGGVIAANKATTDLINELAGWLTGNSELQSKRRNNEKEVLSQWVKLKEKRGKRCRGTRLTIQNR